MKANVFHILLAHLATMKVDGENRYHRPDILLFFAVPLLVCIFVWIVGGRLDKDAFNVSISVFAIFSALLLNVQIALFSIYQREWKAKGDSISAEIQHEKARLRRELLGELNTNISYLIVLSVFSVTVFLIFFVSTDMDLIETPVSVYLYGHFLLTLLMVIKRAHALFQKEYQVE
ncbi:hypothetical protein [Rhizobium laguerreae]|uniref:hypothetical protein n=1 Tax=Rhizobium laguerreae TaxID=1076926 RepID=UPI001C9139A7|nr:hypothetical protein [Rhizobium laguerreae]